MKTMLSLEPPAPPKMERYWICVSKEYPRRRMSSMSCHTCAAMSATWTKGDAVNILSAKIEHNSRTTEVCYEWSEKGVLCPLGTKGNLQLRGY